ncbi:hypothetical protein SprV_0401536700 [Sparganum proliferum]
MPMGVSIQIGISLSYLPKSVPAVFAKMLINSCGYFQTKNAVETEIQTNSEYVEFQTYMAVDYAFEEKQMIMIEVFACPTYSKQEAYLFGSVEFSVGRTIHSGGEDEVILRSGEEMTDERSAETAIAPAVSICIREDPSKKENIVLKMHGEGLDKKDLFGKSDPYILILKKNVRGKWIRCYQSEIIKKSLTPDWKPILISLDGLCEGDLESELCFRCFDWDGAKGDSDKIDPDIDDIIGEFNITTRQLLSSQPEGINFELINRAKCKRKKFYNNSGIVNVRLNISTSTCSFLDYILSGTSINVVVGVDLSSHVPPTGHNAHLFSDALAAAKSAVTCSEYAIAIQAVIEILQEYDSDELFPAYGFGIRAAPEGKITHTFPLTGDPNNPSCKGVSGVLAAYNRVASDVRGTAPPNFSPLIKLVNDMARGSHGSSKYFVLLILTTGLVDDWVETRRAVIEASFLPVSIILIGVGGGKFEELQILDQDFALLKVGHEQACRDNVQFVQMRRFLRLAADGSDEIRWNKVGLAKDVLAELPSQIMDYFTRNRIPPPKKPSHLPERVEQLSDPDWWRILMRPRKQKKRSLSEVRPPQHLVSWRTEESSTDMKDKDRNLSGRSNQTHPHFHFGDSEQISYPSSTASSSSSPFCDSGVGARSSRVKWYEPASVDVVSQKTGPSFKTDLDISETDKMTGRTRRRPNIHASMMRRQMSFEDRVLRHAHSSKKQTPIYYRASRILDVADETLEFELASQRQEGRSRHEEIRPTAWSATCGPSPTDFAQSSMSRASMRVLGALLELPYLS